MMSPKPSVEDSIEKDGDMREFLKRDKPTTL